jgi:hypothetical protein
VEDTAWHPITTAELEKWGDGAMGKVYKFFLGTPLKLWASVGHWALWHFNINKFTEKQRPRVRLIQQPPLSITRSAADTYARYEAAAKDAPRTAGPSPHAHTPPRARGFCA